MKWFERMCLLRALCWECHARQEGRTAEFEAETGVDLQARADEIDEMYERRAA
jgi:hypothetical protein